MDRKPVSSQLTNDNNFVGNIVIWGESKVGKTKFLDVGLQDLHYYPFLGTAPGVRHTFIIDSVPIEANYLDLSSTTIRTADRNFQPDLFTQTLSSAVGIVLLYDITSLASFELVTNQAYMYACMCNRYMCPEGTRKYCNFILVGTKKDVVEKEGREVDEELAEQWAQSQGIGWFEVSCFDKEEVQGAVRELLRAVRRSGVREEKIKEREKREIAQESGSVSSNKSTKEKMMKVFGKMKSGK